jgi:hypothetical protein
MRRRGHIQRKILAGLSLDRPDRGVRRLQLRRRTKMSKPSNDVPENSRGERHVPRSLLRAFRALLVTSMHHDRLVRSRNIASAAWPACWSLTASRPSGHFARAGSVTAFWQRESQSLRGSSHSDNLEGSRGETPSGDTSTRGPRSRRAGRTILQSPVVQAEPSVGAPT